MPSYQTFEDLPVWNAAMDLATWAYDFVEDAGTRFSPAFRDQLERAALSISNNIAEGFERSANPELLYFLAIAKGSAGEVRSMLRFVAHRPRWQPLHAAVPTGQRQAESIGRQLGAWMEQLRNCDFRGARNTTRADHAERQQRENWESIERRKMEECPEGHPLKRMLREKFARLDARR